MDSIMPLLPDDMDAILQRVAAVDDCRYDAAKGVTPALLREFMDDEATDAAFYKALAARSTLPGCRRALLAAASDEQGHLRRLQMEYFLSTGDSYLPAVKSTPGESMLASLRRAYTNELKGSRAYAEAAALADDDGLSAALKGFSEDEARHARAVRRLITEAMT